MTGRVRDPVATVCEVFRLTGTIKQTAKLLGISECAVCKCLVTGDAYSNETSEAIAARIEAGMTPKAIQQELNIAESTYFRYTPYVQRPYISAEKTANALRVARCKARKRLLDGNHK